MSNGIAHNNLNDISKIYLDTISDINKKEQADDVKRWQQEDCECGQNTRQKSPFKKKKVKVYKETLSNWRKDLREVTSDAEAQEIDDQPEIKEKKVKNKIKINPEFKEAVKQMGGELLEVKEVDDEDKEKPVVDKKKEQDDAAAKKIADKERKLKMRILRVKMMATKQDAGSSIVAGYEPEGEVIEGSAYGLYKGSGKPSGAMKAYLDKKAEKLKADKKKQKPEYKNNPAFGDPSHHSNAKNRTEDVEVQEKVLDKFETDEKERIVKGMKKDKKGLEKRYGDKWKNVMYATATKRAKEAGDTSKSDKRYAYEEVKRDEYGDPIGGPKISKKQLKKNLTSNEKDEKITHSESAAWQRKEGKRESGGLNQKGVDSYRRENPGSKLKTAVTTKPSKLKKGSKAANRRKSFCARMGGMKKRLTSAKTARDPDSRINKALRKWNCSYEPQGEMIAERQKDSDNQRLSQERGRSNYGKASIRNVRHTGEGGNAADPAERLVAMDKRHKAHKEKRGVKTKGIKEAKKPMVKVKLKDPSKIKVKVTDIGPGGKEYVRKNEMDEATRYKKEKGYDKGGTKKPSGKKDLALSAVVSMIRKKHGKSAIIGQGSRQQKKVKGAKSSTVGKYKKAADEKKQLKKDAKEMGYGSDTKGYIETRARYGSKENMKSGRGLGT